MTEQEAIDDLLRLVVACEHDPERWADEAFPWGKGELEGQSLRAWQRSMLRHIGKKLQNPATRHEPIRLAVSSGHGIGKSALIAMIADWAMSTCIDCKAVLTANTQRQLGTKTMPEIAKWRRMSLTKDWFNATAMSIRANDERHADTWRLDAVPWSEHNPVAFQGLHNQRKRIVVLYDEGSEIPRIIWQVTEGALTDVDTEIIWVVFANPTVNVGPFVECFTGPQRGQWAKIKIDSRTVEGTNRKVLQQWVDTYGEDSDFVRIRVRGEFPKHGDRQLIPADVVAAAAIREVPPDFGAPVIMGVDVARHGSNQSVIAVRHGRDARSFKARKFRGISTTTLVGEIILAANEVHPDAIFVDGGGVGGGVVDQMKQTGYGKLIREVQSGGEASRKDRYYNMRAEMWGTMAEWLKIGAIENDQELKDDLMGPERDWHRTGSQLIVESKDDMEKRGVASPDHGDALAHTFAGPVARKDLPFLQKFQSGPPVATGAHFDVFGGPNG